MSAKTKLNAFLAGLCLFGATPKAQADAVAPSPAPVTRFVDRHAQSKQYLMTTYKPFLAELEGMRYNVYDDRGNVAVGWGFNFDVSEKKSYDFIEVKPKSTNDVVRLAAKDMKVLASDLSFAEKRKLFPGYNLTEVHKTAAELKAISRPTGASTTFKGPVYVMSATDVQDLNESCLNKFVDETAKAVGTDIFYNWPIGWQMACVDMYYPLRGKFAGSRFLAALKAGKLDTACSEAWASKEEQNKPKENLYRRRQTTREAWLRNTGILPEQCAAVIKEYKARLPGEKYLFAAMDDFLPGIANQNQIKRMTKNNGLGQ